jgi:hypothetical protein
VGEGDIVSAMPRAALALLLMFVLIGPAAHASQPAAAGRPLGPGCDRGRAVHQRVPCMTFVGQSAETALIGITRSASVFYAPRIDNSSPPPGNVLQGPEYVVRSRDLGATWTRLRSGGPTTGGLVPPWMHVDPQTSRVWFLTTLPGLCGARISWSDDEGRHWRTNPSVGCPGQGSERVLEGPPPRGGAKPVGYRHVVYYCGNGVDYIASIVYCYRSLDGGRRFAPTGGTPDPPGTPGACGVNHAARPGTVGPDGALYFPLNLCGKLGVAISRDEGATWHRRLVADTNIQDMYITATATDASGNVYMAWAAGPGPVGGTGGTGLPYLTISRDRGRTWSRPLMVAPRGVKQVRRPAIAATGIGHISVAYLGSTDGGATLSAYITESRHALARRPLFWSASVNDPARPLLSGSRAQTFGDRLFFVSTAFGPHGVPWAAFHCAYEPACRGKRVGVVGRLATR